MKNTFQIRKLSSEEESYLRQSEFGNRVKGHGPLSILGPSYNPYINSYNVKIDLRRVHLGDGQYIDEAIGWRKAPTGAIINFKYSARDAYLHVFKHLEALGINFITERGYADPEDLLYFETIYFDVVLKGLKYTDEIYLNWYMNRSFLSRVFDDPYFSFQSPESISIFNYLKSLLLGVK
jgi:hypothetical protein